MVFTFLTHSLKRFTEQWQLALNLFLLQLLYQMQWLGVGGWGGGNWQQSNGLGHPLSIYIENGHPIKKIHTERQLSFLGIYSHQEFGQSQNLFMPLITC